MNKKWLQPRGWLRMLLESIGAPQKVEITLQRDELYIIHRDRSSPTPRVWCEKCGHDVEVADLGEAKALAAASQLMLPDGAAPEAWHVCTEADGTPLICMESLMKSLRARTGKRPRKQNP